MSDLRRKFDDQLVCHFVTFSCHRRRRLLDLDHPKRLLLGQFNSQLTLQSAKCVGFVVMPDHVHAVIWFPQSGQLRRFMQSWKRTSSYRIREWYRANKTRYFQEADEEDRFWTPKYYAFEIESQRKLEEKLVYMHLNPVRAGLVERAVDWKWSSARWYDGGRTVGVPMSWVE